MKTTRILETRGIIIKEERVKSVTSNILENTLVLENTDAFPGYYGENLPDEKKPRSLFVILDKKYDGLLLARTLKKISDGMQNKCYGSFGSLTINGKVYECIRIKNLDCFASLVKIQSSVIKAGVGLMKYHPVDGRALIRIHKSFLVKPVDVGVLKDLFEPDRYYLTIPRTLEWEDFKKITGNVKSNLDNYIFDAAIGCLWRIDGLMDIIRIYDKNNDPERIKIIRDKYLAEINRLSLS